MWLAISSKSSSILKLTLLLLTQAYSWDEDHGRAQNLFLCNHSRKFNISYTKSKGLSIVTMSDSQRYPLNSNLNNSIRNSTWGSIFSSWMLGIRPPRRTSPNWYPSFNFSFTRSIAAYTITKWDSKINNKK